MTGAEDLDRYGRWDRHPDYGPLWIPARVSPGWAPYRFGHWTWISPWGWTWVDDAPWGFAPFHYGRWVSWGGRWCWAPGGYVARPVYAPALVAWIGGSNVSVGITVGSSRPPLVGWVPLAPRERWVPYYPASAVYVRNVNVTHVHVHPSRPPRERDREPIMYTNRGVPGGVTMVSSDVLRQRRPVMNAIVDASDPDIARRVATERVVTDVAPAAPQRRVVATAPVPPAPGRVIDPRRERSPAARDEVRRVGQPAPPRPSAMARPTGPAGGDASPQRYAPRGDEADGSSGRQRPGAAASVRPAPGDREAERPPVIRVPEQGPRPTPREPARMPPQQRAETREAMPESRPHPSQAARPPQAQRAPEPQEAPRAMPAQRPVMPAAPPQVSRPAPQMEAPQSPRPGYNAQRGNNGNNGNDERGGQGSRGGGPRQQER
jgi:hypothetical protein